MIRLDLLASRKLGNSKLDEAEARGRRCCTQDQTKNKDETRVNVLKLHSSLRAAAGMVIPTDGQISEAGWTNGHFVRIWTDHENDDFRRECAGTYVPTASGIGKVLSARCIARSWARCSSPESESL